MTERKPHPDNVLINRLEEEGAVAEGGRAGHNVSVDVGTRSELRNAVGATGNERPLAQDNTEAVNESKGDKALGRLAPDNNG